MRTFKDVIDLALSQGVRINGVDPLPPGAEPIYHVPGYGPQGKLPEPGQPPAPATFASTGDGSTIFEEKLLQTIGIDVLGRTKEGQVGLWSTYHRQKTIVKDINSLSFRLLLGVGGPPFKANVVRKRAQSTPDGMYDFDEVADAISTLAGYRRLGADTEVGAGCWQGAAGKGAQSVLLVGDRQAAEWNGSTLLPIFEPVRHDRVFDFDSGCEWLEFDNLKKLVERCDQKFAEQAIEDLQSLLTKWRWRSQQQSCLLTAGLILATWVQTLWDWRPQVAVIGASNAGKSTLFKAMAAIFGKLVIGSSRSSAAGLRQALRTSAKVALLDEFEEGRDRPEILEMLRRRSILSYGPRAG